MTEYANEAPYKTEFYRFRDLPLSADRESAVNMFLGVCQEFNLATIGEIVAEENGQDNVNKYISQLFKTA